MAQHADIIVPAFSDDIDDVQVTNWLKSEGEGVVFGEPIVELEVNKSAVELESPVDGVLEAIYCWEGEEVITGERIAVIVIGGYGNADDEEFDFKDSDKFDL